MLVFASIFLASLGVFSHNVFADTASSTISGVGSSFISTNPVTNKVYAINSNTIFVIDGSTNSISTTLSFGNTTDLVGIGVNPVTNEIYVGDQKNNVVHVIDGNTNAIIANVTHSAKFAGIAANPNTNKVYVGSNDLIVINGSTNQIKSELPTATDVSWLAINPITNKIYIPCSPYCLSPHGNQAFISIIDGSTDTVVGQINIPWNGQELGGIAVNPNTNTIYQTDFNNHVIYVFDGNTNALTSTISTSADGFITVNPNTNKIYASDGSSSINIIDGSTNKVIQTLQVGNSPWEISANPNTNKIYVANSGSNFVSIIDGNSSSASTAPSTPQNLQATASNSQVVLTWSIPSSNGGSPITNYKIYKSTSSGTETLFATTGNVTSYNDTSVTNGQTYFYKVTATNSVGESSQSNETSAIPSGTGVTVKSVDQNNNPIYGMFTLLCSQGTSTTANGSNTCETGQSRLASGNTTVTFNAPQGQTFGVDVYNNATCSFNHWSDNTANTYKFRLFTASNPPSILTAVYSCGNTTTVPQSPTGVIANSVSASQINLSWTAPSNNGGSPITGYKIERSTDNGTTWSNVQSNTGSTATAYNDTGLAPSTTYTYRVSAINSVGTSPPSNTASATTSAVTPPPPTGIVLNNIQSTSGIVSSSPYQITLANFNAGTGSNQLLVVGISANNNNVASVTFGGAQLTKKVSSFSNNDAEFWYLKNPSSTGNIVVTMAGPTSAVVGAYSFSGVNQTSSLPTSTTNHNSAAGSPTVSITTTNPNDWVLDLPSIYGGVTLGSPTCTPQWNTHMPSAVTGASSSIMQTTAGSVTCKWTASSGEMWDDVAVEVKASGTGSGSTITVPSSPTGLTATSISSSQINLSWTAPANSGGATITGYKIERSTDSGYTWSSLVANTGSTSTKYSDTGLSPSTSYTYRVSAINSAGSSAPSNISSATTPSNMTVPSPPTGLATTVASSSQINLSWTAPSSNGGSAITGYDAQRSINNGNTWSTVVSNTGSTATTYNDTGLSPSTTYTYRVSAINSVGTGSPSNISSATTSTVTTSGGITLANVQSTSGSTSPSNPIMLADFNVGTGNNRLLVVGVSADNSNAASVTFGGVPLTKKVSTFSNNDAEFWYLKNPTGTGAIVVTMSGSTSAVIGAYSFSGVNQSSPLPTSIVNHNSVASSPIVSITTKFANDWVLDLPSIYGGVTLGSPTCTPQWNTHMPSAITGASSSAMVQSPGSVTCKWTANSADLWDDAAIEIAASK